MTREEDGGQKGLLFEGFQNEHVSGYGVCWTIPIRKRQDAATLPQKGGFQTS